MRPAKHIHLISSPIKPALLLFDPDQALLLMARCCGGHRWHCYKQPYGFCLSERISRVLLTDTITAGFVP